MDWNTVDGLASKKKRVLIVDDEQQIRTLLGAFFEKNGYNVALASCGDEARHLTTVYKIDLAVLDVVMPGEDGLSLCHYFRDILDLPVIMLTACSEEVDRIAGFDKGADDYVTKPFSPRELLARAQAVLRRASPRLIQGARSKVHYQFGCWTLKTDERILLDEDGVVMPLSTGEYRLLCTLVMRPHVVLTREQLLELSRGRAADGFNRSIDNMIGRIRRKIEADPKNPEFIKTIWGGGYMFSADIVTF